MKKMVFVFVLLTAYAISFLPDQISIVHASDYKLQVTDSRDTDGDVDFKNIYARADDEFIYFKFESWFNWNLSRINASLCISICNKQSNRFRDADYFLMAFESEGRLICMLLNLRTEDILDISYAEFFRRDNPITIIRVSRRDLRLTQNTNFSVNFAIVNIASGRVIDSAPDQLEMTNFKKGPTTNRPVLNVVPKNLDFGYVAHGQNPEVKFNVSNEGNAELSVQVESTASLFVTPENLTLPPYGIAEVVIRINHDRASAGPTSHNIQISSNGGNDRVTITLDLQAKPILHVDATTINFGQRYLGERPTRTFNIRNENIGDIRGTINASHRWITINKTSFNANRETVRVSLNSRALRSGENRGRITISSTGGDHVIEVSAELLPTIDLDIKEIDFEEINYDEVDQFPEQEIRISNSSPSRLSLKIETTAEWLIATPKTVEVASQRTARVTISIDKNKLERETYKYSEAILIKSDYEEIELPLYLSVYAPPPLLEWIREDEEMEAIHVEVITGQTHDEIIEITNTGGGILQGRGELLKKDTPHRLFRAHFSLAKGETHDFRISFNSSGQELGDYKEIFEITTNAETLKIPLVFTVVPLPDIVIRLYIGLPHAFIDDKQVMLDAAPYISEGSSMVPLRFIGEAFDAEIEWQNIGRGRILIKLKDLLIRLDIGENTAYINHNPVPLTVPPEIKNNRTFVPIRFISEGFGATVEWDGANNMITIRFSP